MDLKTTIRVLNILFGVLVLTALLLFVCPSPVLLFPIGGCASGINLLSGLFLRCPGCGQWLGRTPGAYCPHCGEKLPR